MERALIVIPAHEVAELRAIADRAPYVDGAKLHALLDALEVHEQAETYKKTLQEILSDIREDTFDEDHWRKKIGEVLG